ncbi:MAG: peptide MFS transporter [Sphingobium sp.]|nr:peptide MFS transporter [Sphingobium sp.]
MTTAEATPSLTIADHADKAFVGHPKGLGYLTFAEAWERFSYYGMQNLLVLYMVKYLLVEGHSSQIVGFDAFRSLFGLSAMEGQPLASAIYGNYTAFVYLTPFFGGLLADQLLGRRYTVMIGALLMATGHFLMAFNETFLFALLALILGSGCFKGNIASQVGALYKAEDMRRADAFQVYYLGINLAGIVTPIVVGTLGEKLGWHYGFGAAGIGMLLSIAIYLSGRKYLPADNVTRAKKERKPRTPLTARDWQAVAALLLLIPVMSVAIVPNNQIFNAYLVWGDERFDLVFFSWRIPTTYLTSIDAIASVSIMALTVFFYRWYGKRWQEPSEITKMIIGSAFSVAGMLCLYMAAETTPADHKISLFWPMMFELLNSIGFAHLLPVSLALFARLAPPQLNAAVIGLYYLAFFGANKLVGYVGGFYSSMRTTEFWLMHAGFAAAAGAVFLLFRLLLARHLTGEPEAAAA